MNTDYTLFIFNTAPYNGTRVQEGLDALFAYAAFDQPVKVLFAGDGTLCWTGKPEGGWRKNISKWLEAFEMYDITEVYLHKLDADKRNLKDLAFAGTLADSATSQSLIHHARHVLSF